MRLSSFVCLSFVFLGAAITGCWSSADSDPRPLPTPAPSDGGSAQLCFRSDPAATRVQTSAYCTSMLRVDASAQCFGLGTDVYVSMFSLLDLESFLELGGGDALQASTATESHDLTLQSTTDGTLHYTAHFESSDPGLVTIAFTRGSHDQPGGLARVQVASPFAIVGAPSSFTYGHAIDFSVSPPPQSQLVAAYIDGPCVVGQDAVGQETTVPVFQGNVALASSNMFLPGGECNVTIHTRVETTGSFDSVFEQSSTFSGLQERDFQSAMSL